MIQVLSNSINCLEKYPVGVWDLAQPPAVELNLITIANSEIIY